MMKATALFLVIIIGLVVFSASSVVAQNEETESDIEVPAGMEVKKVGATNILVPKGAGIRKEGASLFVEGTNTLLSRKLRDIEMRFNKLEVEHRALVEEVEQLQKIVDTLQQSSAPTVTSPTAEE